MKNMSVVTLVIAIFISSAMLNAISLLSDLEQPTTDIRMEDLTAGNLWGMFSGRTFWSSYPTVPRATNCLDVFSMFLVGSLTAITSFTLRAKWRASLAVIGGASLCIGSVPYTIGWFALRSGSIDPTMVGGWLAVMICGVLYASLIAAVLATVDLGSKLLLNSAILCNGRASVARSIPNGTGS